MKEALDFADDPAVGDDANVCMCTLMADYVQTRLQVRRGEAAGAVAGPDLFSGLYDGVGPPLLAGLPSGENMPISAL